jgi:AraC-like DNA-binding protein
MSESGFYRSFKNEMGISPVDFIKGERIKLAHQLLQQGQLSIREIALRSGFNSPSYFTRMFKRHFGVSPASFQN